MRSLLFILITVFLMPGFVSGQYTINQGKVWAFGTNCGLNFNTGSPVAFSTALATSEGCASVSDASGALQFYTDGQYVYNRTGGLMPSGSGIVSYGTYSSSQAALIIPVVGSTTQYYVFSLEYFISSGTGNCRMAYCIVDMTLAGGLGDVIASTRGTAVNSGLAEKMTAIPGNNCDVWLMTHARDSAVFYAYNVNASGFTTSPVVSHIGSFNGSGAYAIGLIKGSHDRTKIVAETYTTKHGCELFDFNATTGVVSNCRLLDSTNGCYGGEFSPDNSKYYSEIYAGAIYQYDVTLGTAAAIRASRYTVTTPSYSDMKLGPDGKIYFAKSYGASTLACLATPNSSGSGCGYTASGATLTSGTSTTLGMPNMVAIPTGGDTTFKKYDTSLCLTPGDSLTLAADATGASYYWNDGTTSATHRFGAFGTYWVLITNPCHFRIDTFNVLQNPFDTTGFRRDTSACVFSAPITLTGRSGYPIYHWFDGSVAPTHAAPTSGNYWVAVTDSCSNVLVDTIHVDFVAPDTVAGNATDTSFCVAAGSITLNAPAGYSSYHWNTGSSSATITAGTTGTYIVYSTSGCNVRIDSFHVNVIPLPLVNLGNDTSVCVGSSFTLSSSQPAGYGLLWNTGNTTSSQTITSAGTYWLQVTNGCTVTDTIHVVFSPYPVVDLGPDSFNCSGTPVLLSSAISYSSPFYLWSDGTTGPTDVAVTTGYYWLRVTVAGCSATDTIHITVIYDTFTLISRDTAICRGKAVQALATNNPVATYQWLPTAGIAVSNVASPYITPDTSAMYIMTVHIAGCPDRLDSFFIEVQPNPDVFIGGNRLICEFDTIHIHASVHPMWFASYLYNWSPGFDLDNTNTANVVYTAGSSRKYILTVVTSAGCIGYDSAQLIVNPGNFDTVSPDINLCPHDSAQLIAGGPAGTTYRWHPTLYLSDTAAASPWVHPISSVNYSVIATSQQGCKDTVVVRVTVWPNAVLALDDSVILYPGESIQLSPATNCSSFSWFPPSGLSDPYISNPVATPTLDTKYFVHGITSNGCEATDSISIRLSAETLLAVPNAFTPGTGVNRLFGIIKRGEAILNYFRIFNRWGNLVFDAKSITDGWNGSYKGTPQPEGVYVYEIQAVTSGGIVFNKHGNVSLLR